MKLTNNFSLSEVFEWGKFQGLSATDSKLLSDWQKEQWNEKVHLPNAIAIAKDMQSVRDWVNAKYPGRNIGIRAVSWYRPVKWELHRKRSGASQHTNGGGVDFVITNVAQSEYNRIMGEIFAHLKEYNGGLARLFRNNHYSFIHIDKGRKRRWEY